MKQSQSGMVIDIFGQAAGATGWSTHSVSFARALNELTAVRFPADRRTVIRGLLGPLRAPLLRSLRRKPGDFGIVITGDHVLPQNSSRWIVWETTVLDEAQRQKCASTEFLWTPSAWGKTNLIANGIDAARLAVVPEGVDADFFRPGQKRGGKFRFLMVGKWEERKFIEGLLKAFTEEFKAAEDVELYLHAHNPYRRNISVKDKIVQAGYGSATNIVIGESCALPALRELYQSADCFVLPTRAEGWGLPILESMACGVPAIVTRYSAPVEYITEQNGYPLNVARMVEAHDDVFNIHSGLWAEPDVPHLKHLMRTAFQDRDQLAEKGRQARLTSEQFTWKYAARIALDTIQQHLSRRAPHNVTLPTRR